MTDLDRLAVLAHEVRSPVAALTAISEALPAADEETSRRLLQLAKAAVAGIERLLTDATVASVRPERLDAGHLASDAAEAASLGGVHVIAESETGLYLNGDRDRLRQALANLVENAVGHSPGGGSVTVTARREGDQVVLAVSDEGDGIASEDLVRVFEPGVRLTEARPGAGLGLAVARTIAQAHGGELAVDSRPGEGTTFRLVLPGASAAC